MKQEMYDEMYRIEDNHWWFHGKYTIIEAILKRKYQANPFSVADMGCGTGIVISRLSAAFPKATIVGMDFSQEALMYCRKRFQGNLLSIDLSKEISYKNHFNCVLALDLLEHIETDDIAAQNLCQALALGGVAIVTVPAFQFMWSAHDENCMHKRRYTKKQLEKLMIDAGFTLEYVSYYNSLLFPPMMLVRLLKKIFRLDGNSKMENSIPPVPINCFLKWLFSLERRWICRNRHFPFGGSLICVAMKKDAPLPPFVVTP